MLYESLCSGDFGMPLLLSSAIAVVFSGGGGGGGVPCVCHTTVAKCLAFFSITLIHITAACEPSPFDFGMSHVISDTA